MGSLSEFETAGADAVLTLTAKPIKSKAFERKPQHEPLQYCLAELYSENVTAKVLRSAVDNLFGNVNEQILQN